MKDIVHLFTAEDISTYLLTKDPKIRPTRNVEFYVPAIMQKVYEKQWGKPVDIGFYLKDEYVARLKSEKPSRKLYAEVFEKGIQEDHHIDFLLINSVTTVGQMFQLKTFGIHDQELNTENLINYINKFQFKYPKIDSTFLITVTDVSRVDFVEVEKKIEKNTFPFSELLIIGVHNEEFFTVGILPNVGWGHYPLRDVIM